MTKYVISRSAQGIVTIWVVVTVVFLLTTFLGNPVLHLLPMEFTPAQYDEMVHLLGYDRPVIVQYWDFLSRVWRGDFGMSPIYNRPAMDLAMERLPFSASLAAVAVAVSCLIGIPLGIVAGYKAGRVLDRVSLTLATVGQAVPIFVIAILFIMIFGVWLHALPVAGVDDWRSFVLPVASLSAWATAALLRFSRSGTRETMSQPFVLMARAKGLAEYLVLGAHVFRSAMLPVITFGGLQFGMLLSGAVVTESVFALPGLGRLALDSVLQRDANTVRAVVVLVAVAFVVINLLTDLTYTWLDPRVRLARGD
jgi:peptide/nickel transport system permease protein